MILLRNLMLAVGAFVVAGSGFYAYLLHRLPPEQVSAQAEAEANLSPSYTNASANKGTATDGSSESSSSIGLFTAVIGDFVDASRSGAAADAARDQTAFEARYKVPEWLNHRFEQAAGNEGKVLTRADKSTLLATMLELRQMKYDQMNSPTTSQGGIGDDAGVSRWELTARAMQAELQFRQTLGIGLAEFMKKMDADELQQLLALPMDQSTPSQPTRAAAQSGTTSVH